MSAVADKLAQARKLIERPRRWTQGAFARDANGRRCAVGDKDARKFCAEGALKLVCETGDQFSEALGLLDRAANQPTFMLNDRSTHAEVIEAFKRAEALARGESF